MKTLKLVWLVLGIACLSPMVATAQPAVTLTTLVNFNGTNGSEPFSELTFGADGNFYSTTSSGGTNAPPGKDGYGTVFRMSLDGTFTSLVSFDGTSGWSPVAGLTQDSQGNFYGSTSLGGINVSPYGGNCGNIFRLSANGTFTSTFSFNNADGAFPQAPLQPGSDGNFYGITQSGGTNLNDYGTGDGTVFQISPDGRLTTLFEFNWTNGAFPMGPVLLGTDGNIYGTTDNGGSNDGYGTVFKLTTNGTLTTLATFNGTNGAGSRGGLLFGKDGNLYGTTLTGGTNNSYGVVGIRNDTNSVVAGYGTIFRLQPDGTLTTLVYFNETNGDYPHGNLLFGPDGNIYGTTSGYPGFAGNGTIFQLLPDGSFNTLVTFNGTNGAAPYAGLALGPDGNFYGTTRGGGAYGKGTVFRLTVPMTPVLQPVASSSGQFVFSWNSVAGLNYQVQYNSDAGSTNWVDTGPVITASNGTTFQTNAIARSQGFYRVLLVP